MNLPIYEECSGTLVRANEMDIVACLAIGGGGGNLVGAYKLAYKMKGVKRS